MKTDVIEVVRDVQLRKHERQITKLVKEFCPACGPVKLYRTADGRIGFQIQLTLTPENRKQVETVHKAIMKYLGERRGRPNGVETVQTKLRLPKPVYAALKKVAAESRETMSNVVAESLLARFKTKQAS